MIPKRAIFFWEGPEMSWLRKQSIETFQLLNPSWEVEVIDGSGVPIQPGGRLQTAWRSDWARYKRLFDVGGMYFDTDIVFCKPIPDEWLQHEIILPLSEHRLIDHVAVLGSVPGASLFRDLLVRCETCIPADGIMSYQHFGVELLDKKEGIAQMGITGDVMWIEPHTFVPVWYTVAKYCWRKPPGEPSNIYGLHWFGGDWLSMEMEQHVNEQWAMTSDSLLAMVWRMARNAKVSATQ